MRRVTLLVALALAVLALLWLLRGEAQVASTPAEPAQESVALPASPSTALAPGAQAVGLAAEPAAADPAPRESAGEASAAECRVTGRVVDEIGAPMSGVSVRLDPRGNERWTSADPAVPMFIDARRRAVTGPDGRFLFTCDPPTCARELLEVEGGVRWCGLTMSFGDSNEGARPKLGAEERELGDLRVSTCGAIAGRVVNTTSEPIYGTPIRRSVQPGPGARGGVATDAAGRFLLVGLPVGEVQLTVGDDPWIERRDVAGTVKPAGTTELGDIVLQPAWQIRGTVVDEEGHALEGISVAYKGPQWSNVSRRTGPDGTFVCYLYSEDAHVLTIGNAAGYEPWGGPAEPAASVRPGGPDLRIVLRRRQEMTFQVVDAATRAPIERYLLFLRVRAPGAVLPDDRGRALEHHPAGEVHLPASRGSQDVFVRADGYAPATVEVREDSSGSARQTIELSAEARLSGRVLLRGSPVAARVRIERERMDKQGQLQLEPRLSVQSPSYVYDVTEYAGRLQDLRTPETGEFEFGQLSTGTYRLLITATGAASHWERGIRIERAGLTNCGDIALTEGAVLEGRLITADGGSARGYAVRLDGIDDRSLTLEDDQGSFRIDSLPAGRHSLNWAWPDEPSAAAALYGHRAQALDLAVGEVRQVTIDTRPFARCEFVVRVRRGRDALAGADLNLRQFHPGPRGSSDRRLGKTDENGALRTTVDGSTEYQLSVRPAGEPLIPLTPRQRSTPGERIELDLVLCAGRVVVELSADYLIPDGGALVLSLKSEGGYSASKYAYAPGEPARPGMVWSGPVVDFGEFLCGEMEATVTVQVTERVKDGSNAMRISGSGKPYQTPITIRDGERTVIRVP